MLWPMKLLDLGRLKFWHVMLFLVHVSIRYASVFFLIIIKNLEFRHEIVIGKWKQGMKLGLPPKLVEKLVCVPSIWFCRFSFTVTHLMPYYAETGRFRPLIARLYR